MRFQYFFIAILLFALSYSCKEKDKVAIASQVLLEFQAQPKVASIRGISVIDTNIIWMSGAKSTVLKSMDGGRNWDSLKVPSVELLDFRDVEAFSDKEAIIVSAAFPSRVYKTKDDGTSWYLVHENNDSSAFMNSIYFKNAEEGLIFGDKLGERHLILKTIDAGESWVRIVDSMLPQPLAMEHGYAASGSCITQNSNGEYVIGLGGEVSRVYVENQKHWEAFITTMNGGMNTSGIYSIASGDSALMAVGGDYLKPDSSYFPTMSFDDGESWEQTKARVNGYRSVVDYSKNKNAWIAAGINGLDYSFNRGESWTYLKTEEINTLQFDPQGYYAWAAGPKGKIWKIKIID
jgi:photosystem II stability/assembly factor-like uncharacterized protein